MVVYIYAFATSLFGGTYFKLKLNRHGDALYKHVCHLILIQFQKFLGDIPSATIKICRCKSIIQLILLLKSISSIMSSTHPFKYHMVIFAMDLLQHVPYIGVYVNVVRVLNGVCYGEWIQSLLSFVLICIRIIPNIKTMIQQQVYQSLITELQTLVNSNRIKIMVAVIDPDNWKNILEYVKQIVDSLKDMTETINVEHLCVSITTLLTKVHTQSNDILIKIKRGHAYTQYWIIRVAILGTVVILMNGYLKTRFVSLCIAKLVFFIMMEKHNSILGRFIIPRIEECVNCIDLINCISRPLMRILIR